MRSLRFVMVALAAAGLLAGCGQQTQKVQFFLTDAPLEGVTAVNVTLTGLKVFTSGMGTRRMHQEGGGGMRDGGSFGPRDGMRGDGGCQYRDAGFPRGGGDGGMWGGGGMGGGGMWGGGGMMGGNGRHGRMGGGMMGGEAYVFDEPRTYNLLELRNGAEVLLGEVEVEGTIQLLMLQTQGDATVVSEDGTTRTARIPSGMHSGLKIMGPFPTSGTVLLDFDVEQSLFETEAGELILRPVIHVIIDGQKVTTVQAELE